MDQRFPTFIREYKTASADYTQEQVDNAFQATAYIYAHWKMTGQLLPLEYIIANKKKKTIHKLGTLKGTDLYLSVRKKSARGSRPHVNKKRKLKNIKKINKDVDLE